MTRAPLIEEHSPNSTPNSPAVIARALTGRILNRTGTQFNPGHVSVVSV